MLWQSAILCGMYKPCSQSGAVASQWVRGSGGNKGLRTEAQRMTSQRGFFCHPACLYASLSLSLSVSLSPPPPSLARSLARSRSLSLSLSLSLALSLPPSPSLPLYRYVHVYTTVRVHVSIDIYMYGPVTFSIYSDVGAANM